MFSADSIEVHIGPYKLLKKLDAGGMGEVYLVEDVRLGRKVALKMLLSQFTRDPERLTRFILEAKAASALNHPNIITIFEIGEANGRKYIATEYIEGLTLRQEMAAPITIAKALDVGIQVAGALSAAHQSGIIHRDVKPENVIMRPDGLIKVLDFGIAKLVERPVVASENRETVPVDSSNANEPAPTVAAEITAQGTILGTVGYMSPEQVRGLALDARSDIFSLGVVLYEMVAAETAFGGSTLADKVAAVLAREPAPLSDYVSDVPAELERIIKLALCKDRESRYQDINQMLSDLKELKQDLEFQQKLGRPVQVVARNHLTARSKVNQTGQQIDAQTTSSTRTIVSELKEHKRVALTVLMIFIAATLGVVYLGQRFYGGSSNSGITSIAVLPFKNTSNDPEKEYLSDGISESLINRLSQLPGMKVIANSSSSKYKGEADPQEVARALNITGVLTGRITERGDFLTVSVELIDGRDRTLIWGEQYNRKATDLLTVQAEISREITEKLRLRLTTGQQQRLALREAVKPEAYELLLKGYSHRSKGGTEDRKKAAEYFNQAIVADPQYALAYAELSDIDRSLVGSGLLDPREYTAKATATAQKAIELDEGVAEAHYALANMKTFAWEWEAAEREYKRAIELNPNLALAHRWYAVYLTLISRHEQAIDEIKRARELDPLSPGLNATVGYVLYFARRYDEAIESLNTTREMNRDYPYTYLFLGFTYAAQGKYNEAIAAYQEAIRLGLDTPSTQIFLGTACALAGDRERARTILKRLPTSNSYASAGHLAILYAALDEREQAFASLETAFEAHDLQLQYLGVSPMYDPLRSDLRFENLVRRVGLPR